MRRHAVARARANGCEDFPAELLILPAMTSEIITDVFAWAPLTAFVIVMIILYLAKRHAPGQSGAPMGKTYACAQCGRRGAHEHMVPVTHEGAVVWYCSRCAH